MTTPREQFEEILGKMKEHNAYQTNPRVRKLVDSASFVASKGEITPKEVLELLAAIKKELQNVLSQSDKNESTAAQPPVNASDKITDPDEELIHNLHLKQQYWDQRRIYDKYNVGHLMTKGLKIIDGCPTLEVTGQKMPDWNEVSSILQKNREKIKEKSAQGFRQLLIVPFGLNLPDLVETFKKLLLVLDQNNQIINSLGQRIQFKHAKYIDNTWPLYISADWETGTFSYATDFPAADLDDKNIWKTKPGCISLLGPWQIYLVENRPILEDSFPEPNEADSAKYNIRARAKLGLKENTITQEYINDFQQKYRFDQAYGHERLIYPETYLWMQITSLLNSPVPLLIDHIANHINSGTYLAGCRLSTSVTPEIPRVGWHGAGHFRFGENRTNEEVPNFGIRTVVPLK